MSEESAGVEVMQSTLTGGKQLLVDIEELRELPDTFVECPECGERVLRSRKFDHEHEIWNAEKNIRTSEPDPEEDEEDEPERVGSWYDITLEYNVTYRFRVPAWTDHQAEDLAKDWRLDAKPADKYHLHTDRREIEEITTEDVPDDWDPCGDTRLWEVFEDGE